MASEGHCRGSYPDEQHDSTLITLHKERWAGLVAWRVNVWRVPATQHSEYWVAEDVFYSGEREMYDDGDLNTAICFSNNIPSIPPDERAAVLRAIAHAESREARK
jgi:hypothetical protein